MSGLQDAAASSLICGNKIPTRCNRGVFLADVFLLEILLLAQHLSGTNVPIIMSSR